MLREAQDLCDILKTKPKNNFGGVGGLFLNTLLVNLLYVGLQIVLYHYVSVNFNSCLVHSELHVHTDYINIFALY